MTRKQVEKLKEEGYQQHMVDRQISILEELAQKGTFYKLGANYCPYEWVNPDYGFDCASSAMYGIEKAVNHEILCGNQNVILNEAKKISGIFDFINGSPEPGDLCIVNYPAGNKYDMKPYGYGGIFYPDPADHVFTVGRGGKTIDTGYDDKKATVIKEGSLSFSIKLYEGLGADLTFIRPNYIQIKKNWEKQNV